MMVLVEHEDDLELQPVRFRNRVVARVRTRELDRELAEGNHPKRASASPCMPPGCTGRTPRRTGTRRAPAGRSSRTAPPASGFPSPSGRSARWRASSRPWRHVSPHRARSTSEGWPRSGACWPTAPDRCTAGRDRLRFGTSSSQSSGPSTHPPDWRDGRTPGAGVRRRLVDHFVSRREDGAEAGLDLFVVVVVGEDIRTSAAHGVHHVGRHDGGRHGSDGVHAGANHPGHHDADTDGSSQGLELGPKDVGQPEHAVFGDGVRTEAGTRPGRKPWTPC